jgi:hypothetical protein
MHEGSRDVAPARSIRWIAASSAALAEAFWRRGR